MRFTMCLMFVCRASPYTECEHDKQCVLTKAAPDVSHRASGGKQPVKPLPLRYPSMPSLSWVNHWLLCQGPLANTTHCKGAPRTRGGHNSKTPDSDAALLKNVCGTILSLLKKAKKCVCTIPKAQRNRPPKESKPNITHKARF